VTKSFTVSLPGNIYDDMSEHSNNKAIGAAPWCVTEYAPY